MGVMHEPNLQHLLIILGQRAVHPADFDFDDPDEAEERTIEGIVRERETGV